jgi:gluconokinase
LTGEWIEDHGMASASGLYNITENRWDRDLLALVQITEEQLPRIGDRAEIIGHTAPGFGLPENVPVITGSGDGFLASVGSDCETPAKLSVTLGTSAVVRQSIGQPVLNSSSGTFCYTATHDSFLLGCAGSNGGNVLDWGRSILGTLQDANASTDPPIFIPLLHGERSPDWNPQLTGSWHGLKARHTAADLSRSILEGVVFNLAHFVEVVQSTSGRKAADVVLSGNGFLHPLAAPILAGIVDATVWMPAEPGFASLRGAGICALQALAAPVPALQATAIEPLHDSKIRERYARYREVRGV